MIIKSNYGEEFCGIEIISFGSLHFLMGGVQWSGGVDSECCGVVQWSSAVEQFMQWCRVVECSGAVMCSAMEQGCAMEQ